MKKTICVATGTRAEYGLLRPLIRAILQEPCFVLRLLVTGMHLCPEFGLTYKEIEDDEVSIDEKIEMILSSDTHAGMVKSTGLAMISFADYFQRKCPDLLVILGDRYEMFACASSAAMMQIPIAHLYGGDTTEGAIDEFIRHSITKMSYLHFVSCESSRKRVIQLGEDPCRIFNFGALGAENIKNIELLSLDQLSESIRWPIVKELALVTFHPVTMESSNSKEQIQSLFKAIEQFGDKQFLFTKANADAEGHQINQMIDCFIQRHPNCFAVTSLGTKRYLSAMKYCKVVIGNSSSGLYEAPSFHIPTVNIGNRQRGREQADSIINCAPEYVEIVKAIRAAFSDEWVQRAKKSVSPFGDGNASKKILTTFKQYLKQGDIVLKKSFYEMGEKVVDGFDCRTRLNGVTPTSDDKKLC